MATITVMVINGVVQTDINAAVIQIATQELIVPQAHQMLGEYKTVTFCKIRKTNKSCK